MTLLHIPTDPTQAEALYDLLKLRLMTGIYAPGRKLSIRSLADESGFGEAAVREALKRLASERVLEGGVKRSYNVPDLDEKRAADLFNLRVLVECEAAANALPNMKAPQLAKMRSHCTAMNEAIRAVDIDGYMSHNHAFHFVMYERCGNADMIAVIEQLWMQTGPSLHRGIRTTDINLSWNNNHTAMLGACENNSADELRHLMRLDIGWGAQHYTAKS